MQGKGTMPSNTRRRARRPEGAHRPRKKKEPSEKDEGAPVEDQCKTPEIRQRDTPLPTQQIRHAMAEIRAAFAEKTAPILSRHLETVGLTVSNFCFSVVLQMHKKRRVGSN